MRLIGNIEAKVDAKGRAFLPATFRKVLQASSEEKLVLRKDVFISKTKVLNHTFFAVMSYEADIHTSDLLTL